MRLLRTMLRVGDLRRSIDFYTRVMGMTLLRKTERPEHRLQRGSASILQTFASMRCLPQRNVLQSGRSG